MEEGSPELQTLSGRQAEIAALVARGRSNREIAYALRLSMRTVDGHVAAIYHKLGVRSRVELTALLLRANDEGTPHPSDLQAAKTNLTFPRATLVGRETELEDIASLLRAHRLVTVTGAGGAGKTTVATAAGLAHLKLGHAEVWLVELAPLPNGSFVFPTVARVAGARGSLANASLDRLVAHLERRTLLLILDNCEHVIADAAVLAETLLGRCERLQILATSRAPLQIPGEHTYRLPSLGVPAAHEVRSLDVREAENFSAMVLFTDRATAVERTFSLNQKNVSSVAEICRRLDGMPLAIELAAARMNVLSAQDLAQRLDQRFRILVDGERTALPRHRTMRALIDWSYDLLAPSEQQLFRRLSIFSGGCTLAAAVTVCFDGEVGESAVISLLSSLVDKSLLTLDLGAAEPRYGLLESFRVYLREKLLLSGEYSPLAHRHASMILELAETFLATLRASLQGQLPAISVEFDNWRAALQWALGERGDVRLGQRLAGTQPAWGNFAHGDRRWLQLSLEIAREEPCPPEVVAQLERALVSVALQSGELHEVLNCARRALSAYIEAGSASGVVWARGTIGMALARLGRPAEATPFLLEALAAARAQPGRAVLIGVLRNIAYARSLQGADDAPGYFAEALSLVSASGDELEAAAVVIDMAEAEFRSGQAEVAVRLTADALEATKSLDQVNLVIAALHHNMAAYLITLEQYDEAHTHALESLRLARELQHDAVATWSVQHLAAAAALRPYASVERAARERARAARLLGFVDAHFAALGTPQEHTEKQEMDRATDALRRDIGPEQLTKMSADGAELTDDEAAELASDARA